jgi:hypothetical protein
MTGLWDLLGYFVERELAMADAPRKAIGHGCHWFFAKHLNEIGKGCEEGGVDQHLRLDAVAQGFVPGVEYVAKRRLPLVIIAGLGRQGPEIVTRMMHLCGFPCCAPD